VTDAMPGKRHKKTESAIKVVRFVTRMNLRARTIIEIYLRNPCHFLPHDFVLDQLDYNHSWLSI
jgi:hypothetical protein